ncbi:hypothetical protein [Streptomyces sp. NPDC001389]|uniref:hypothetical protein n=1 Tax=Streptomyces sp. NPDC001389 TaxID=3364569 RepID=UPI003684A382
MTPLDDDSHILHTWNLTHPTGDEIRIDLWTDGESVRVEGGNGESIDGGRKDALRLVEKYCLRGYWVTSDYAVNDPHYDSRPDECPECGATTFELEHNANFDGFQMDVWWCTGCRWGTAA